MTKVYLAARYSRREEMEQYAHFLQTKGYEVIARWVYGGEKGLTHKEIALLDTDDIQKCDTVLFFSDPPGAYRGGNRHIEFGFAYALNKDIFIIGQRELEFHSLPNVFQCNNLQEFIEGKFNYV